MNVIETWAVVGAMASILLFSLALMWMMLDYYWRHLR